MCHDALMLLLLFAAACFLAYSNGANDNFKGVASLYGSQTTSYRTALGWATITTLAGSISAVFLAQALLKAFSGRGIVPDRIAGSEGFLLAVSLGAGITVIAATLLGFPISTTHALTGAIVGSGLVAAGRDVNFVALGKGFLLPLVLSPVLAVAVAAVLYSVLRWLRLRLAITKEWCVCMAGHSNLFQFRSPRQRGTASCHSARLGDLNGSTGRVFRAYAGRFLGAKSQQLIDAVHFLSAGVVSFARGLNDTPKIAAILLAMKALDVRLGTVALAAAIALGGLLNAEKVARTMSLRITSMNHGQGLAANLATGMLVILASIYGLPVSTTHVSVGALVGIGLTGRQANVRAVRDILLSLAPHAAVRRRRQRAELVDQFQRVKWPTRGFEAQVPAVHAGVSI
jgi:PiT family inorganic phosphate transporter